MTEPTTTPRAVLAKGNPFSGFNDSVLAILIAVLSFQAEFSTGSGAGRNHAKTVPMTTSATLLGVSSNTAMFTDPRIVKLSDCSGPLVDEARLASPLVNH
jgi:hypothetical protein